jgi:phosphomannomutase/phosphoglucomutase
LGVIDNKGRILWGDQLMIIFARDILKDRPGAKFIGEVKCSQHLFDEIAKAGGEPIMWKVGHSLIKAKLKEENAVMAGEMSGHLFFADRYYGFDDAVYAGARLLEILAGTTESLSTIYDQLPQAVNTPEIRIACPEEKKAFVLEELAKEYEGKYEVVTIDGLRVKFPRGWGLVRASNTQPVLVLRFEAETKEELDTIHEGVMGKVRALLA